LLLSNSLKKALASLLLLAVFAVLTQGVLHEVFHDSEHENFGSTAKIAGEAGHSNECHSQHQSCSSLSCTHGALFLAESAFCWNALRQIELLKFSEDVFQLPIISANLFRPPRVSIS